MVYCGALTAVSKFSHTCMDFLNLKFWGVHNYSESHWWLWESQGITVGINKSHQDSWFRNHNSYTNLVILHILLITWYKFPYLVNRNHRNQFWNLGIKPTFLKVPNHIDKNSELQTPRQSHTAMHNIIWQLTYIIVGK